MHSMEHQAGIWYIHAGLKMRNFENSEKKKEN
jgi:hypothetical protein